MKCVIASCSLVLSVLVQQLAAAEPAVATPVPPGTVFHFAGMVYVAGRIEFRDPSGGLWPNYFYEGKWGQVRGKMVFDPQSPQSDLDLTCTRLCQPDGGEYKVLGELMQKEKTPTARFTVIKVGPWEPCGEKDPKAGPYQMLPVEGRLDVDGRAVSVKGRGRVRYNLPGGGDLRGLHSNAFLGTSIHLMADFTVQGKDLGLKKAADKPIQVTVYARAYTESTLLQVTKKKTLAEALEGKKR
ncbi:MAG: hypothetical protein ABR915_00070 [Thermoguttaceae bacterium]|jgi:hypothetical protein